MRFFLHLSLLFVLAAGCARIPAESVVLADALQTEGERMHHLNLLLLNRLFANKRADVDKFINEDYTPVAVKEFVALVSKAEPATDFKKEFPELMQALSPRINARRDSLLRALDVEKEKLADKLNADYRAFSNATAELKRLLVSATKINKEKQALFATAKQLTNNRIDFNSVEGAVDKFIRSGGNVGGNVVLFSNAINNLLNK